MPGPEVANEEQELHLPDPNYLTVTRAGQVGASNWEDLLLGLQEK